MNQLAERRNRNSLTQYDPDKGLKSIAVAEGAEKHFERAKDATQLYEAIECKLRGQADYVVYRDDVVATRIIAPGGPGRGKKGPVVPRDLFPEADPGQDVVDRWRKTLCSKDEAGRTFVDKYKLDAALAEAHARCVRICEQHKPPPSTAQGTGEEEWYTPKPILNLARELFGGQIDLDPASSDLAQETVQAVAFFDRDDDGLSKEWWGQVFANPPYTLGIIDKFMDKAAEEYTSGRVTELIMLVNNCTDTKWFHKGVKHCSAICFTLGRTKFISPVGKDDNRAQGQALLYFGNRPLQFKAIFETIGFMVFPAGALATEGAP
jgi:ParB family chromosome partitioning protein